MSENLKLGQRIYTLRITPMAAIRTTQKSDWMMSKTDEELLEAGKKKYEANVAAGKKNPGTPNMYYTKRNYIQEYYEYKKKIKELCRQQGAHIPISGTWVKFYLPMPKSWPKKKRNQLNFELHTQKQYDVDNCLKALMDGMFTGKDDGRIADIRSTKIWVDLPFGWIEIHINALPKGGLYSKMTVGSDELK